MTESSPETRTMSLSAVTSQLSDLLPLVSRQETRILIAEAGVPVAALVSLTDLERLIRLEREKAERFRAREAVSLAFADVPLEELEAELRRIPVEGPQIDEAEPQRKLA